MYHLAALYQLHVSGKPISRSIVIIDIESSYPGH
jgi:hypothetical protein